MKDVEIRGILLNKLYEMRGDQLFRPRANHFHGLFTDDEIARVCKQLKDYDLIKATITDPIHDKPQVLHAEITARGVDVVESGISPDLRIDLMSNQTVNISGSSHVIVGNNNQITIQHSVQELNRVIESSNATPEQKAEAKGLLKKFLEHPLLASIAGAAISLI